MTLTPRVNRLLLFAFSLLSMAASLLIPSRSQSRIVSTVFSLLVMACATVEIRRGRERGPYGDARNSIAPRE